MGKFRIRVERVSAVASRGVVVVGGAIIAGDNLPADSMVAIIYAGRPTVTARVRGVRLQLPEHEADLVLEGIAEDDVSVGSQIIWWGQTTGTMNQE